MRRKLPSKLKRPRASPKYKQVLKAGVPAPEFRLWGTDNQEHSLAKYKGKKIVLYFYPKDNTPGCTVEACSFRDELVGIAKRKAVVLGVSPDNVQNHKIFAERYKLTFPLLADTDHAVAKEYGVWQNRGIFGWGIARTTFVIDPRGKIKKVFSQVNPEGHGKEVLKSL